VVQDWPDAGTNCRSSVQIRRAWRSLGGRILRAAGGADESRHEGRIHQARRDGHFLLINPDVAAHRPAFAQLALPSIKCGVIVRAVISRMFAKFCVMNLHVSERLDSIRHRTRKLMNDDDL
jgi:hypothetical protein